jgi:membrane-associated phospholipid phosphatase
MPTSLLTTLIWIALSISSLQVQSQDPVDTSNVYHLNKWWSASIGVVGTVTDYIGVQRILKKDPISISTLDGLSNKNVPRFDRIALNQNTKNRLVFDNVSHFVSLGVFAAPLLLFFDTKIRPDWIDISLMYYETQMIHSNLYSWGPFGPQWIDRLRPWTYYDEYSFEERTTGRKRNSFFSGHTSTTATACFFMAKVYCDYHPELGLKKWVPYMLAVLPTATVGFSRVKSLHHFPSDVLIGALIGAGTGILVPEVHRRFNVKLLSSYNENQKSFGLLIPLH